MVKKSEMIAEAVERLKLLKICEKDIRSYEDSQKIPCYFVNHEERKLWKKSLTQEQKDVIADLEKDGSLLVYYAIIDTGMWPDGSTFERWSFLAVSKYKSDWDIDKEGIETMVPAYVYNCEVPHYSEYCFMPLKKMGGVLINIS